MLCSNKKRKLPNGQVDSPAPKHECWKKKFPTFQENQKEQGTNRHARNIFAERPGDGNESDQESAGGSNSSVGNMDSAIFSCSDSPPDSQVSTMCSSSALSTCKKSSRSPFSSSNGTEILLSGGGNACCGRHENSSSRPPSGAPLDFCLSVRTNHSSEPRAGEEHGGGGGGGGGGDALCSGDMNFVLDGQRARKGSQKLTIDQEFEQYFSMLLM